MFLNGGKCVKKIVLIFILFTFFFNGCGEKNDSGNNNVQEAKNEKSDNIKTQNASKQNSIVDDVMLVLSNAKKVITTETKDITVDLLNNSNATVSTGNNYKVQYFNKDIWEDIPLSISYEDILYDIAPGDKKSFICSLEGIKDFKSGEYRIVKTVDIEKESHELSVELHVD